MWQAMQKGEIVTPGGGRESYSVGGGARRISVVQGSHGGGGAATAPSPAAPAGGRTRVAH